jgi:hypothetical protein
MRCEFSANPWGAAVTCAILIFCLDQDKKKTVTWRTKRHSIRSRLSAFLVNMHVRKPEIGSLNNQYRRQNMRFGD